MAIGLDTLIRMIDELLVIVPVNDIRRVDRLLAEILSSEW